MSRLLRESGYISRYAGSGLVNTLVGFGIIFFLMWLGVSPYISNLAGYVVGFIVSFVLSKRFVFKSDGHAAAEGIRFILAFIFAYICNLFVLWLAINLLNMHAALAQFVAAASYTSIMYVLARLFVFTPQSSRS